jgi:hypothetical protein
VHDGRGREADRARDPGRDRSGCHRWKRVTTPGWRRRSCLRAMPHPAAKSPSARWSSATG